MNPEAFAKHLRKRIDDGKALATAEVNDDSSYQAWKEDALSLLKLGLPEGHPRIWTFRTASAGQSTGLRLQPVRARGHRTDSNWRENLAAKIRDLERTLELLPDLELVAEGPPARDPKHGQTVNVYASPVANANSTATANATVSIATAWHTAFEAVGSLEASEQPKARELLEELREILDKARDGRARPVPGDVGARIRTLLRYGEWFFIQLLPALLQYGDTLGPMLMSTIMR